MTFRIKLAGRVIEIDSLYEMVYRLCRDYLVDEPKEQTGIDEKIKQSEDVCMKTEQTADSSAKTELSSDSCMKTADIYVKIEQSDIDLERAKSQQEYGSRSYSDAYLETLAVYRKIAAAMLAYDSWLMHGAVLAIHEHAYMLTASSGTGKTTLMRRMLEIYEDSYVVNGDKPLLHIDAEAVLACGTPWSGKERMNRNCQVPLKGIVILERGEGNKVQELSFSQAFPILLQQTYKSGDAREMKKTLELLSALNSRGVKFYRFTLKKYESAADIENEEVTAMIADMIRDVEEND